jgi:16S rRNA (guanine527-N7)-methyltransferase
VKRFTLDDVGRRYGLGPETLASLASLLDALAGARHPPTTVHEPEAAVEVHIADSLAGLELPALRAASAIADLGAGAGFPGLALAAALPRARVDLIESSRRKCQLIDRLATQSGVGDRARAIPHRAEEWAARDGRDAYDAVTARALAPLPVLAEYAAPLLREGGVLVAWKGRRDGEEERRGDQAAAAVGLAREAVVPVQPFPSSRDRHLYLYSKVTPTPNRFPRRPGVAVKRPLA